MYTGKGLCFFLAPSSWQQNTLAHSGTSQKMEGGEMSKEGEKGEVLAKGGGGVWTLGIR